MSRDTISKIDYVPYIVLYYHGKPYVQYEGPYQIEDIMEFIVEMSKNLQAKDSFSYSAQQSSIENVQNVHSREKSIPSYSTGLPMSEMDQISYLKFDDAYESKK